MSDTTTCFDCGKEINKYEQNIRFCKVINSIAGEPVHFCFDCFSRNSSKNLYFDLINDMEAKDNCYYCKMKLEQISAGSWFDHYHIAWNSTRMYRSYIRICETCGRKELPTDLI